MPDEETGAPAPPRTRKLLPTLVVAGLMLLEGGGIFVAMKMFGSGAADVAAAQDDAPTGGPGDDSASPDVAEVVIAVTDATNNVAGRLHVYHIEVSALVAAADKGQLEKLVQERESTIRDRINVVMRGADPKHLNEPGLETVRRQIKFELDKIFPEDSLILELLIPKLMQSRTRL